MSALLTILFIILSCIAIYYGISLCKKKTRLSILPPGPRGIFILGNLHQMAKDAPLKLSQWAAEYGKLYTIRFANKPTLVVNDAVLIKQLFGMSAATGKFSSELFDVSFGGPYGVVNSEGPIWSEQRAFFLKIFCDAGFNKRAQMESIVLEKIKELCDCIRKQMVVQGTVHLSERLKMTSGNILWSVTLGEKQTTIIADLMENWGISINHCANSGLAFFSWIRYIAPKTTGYTDLVQIFKMIHEFVRKYFEDPERNEGHKNDVISAYINHVKCTTDKQSSFYGEEGLKHSLSSVVAVLVGGTESTSAIMNWLIFYLAVNPDVQRKMQREIDEVIGEDGEPTIEDRKRMPYTEAVIEETFRMSTVDPFGVMHILLEDISFMEYQLPKGLILLANIYHVHNDPQVWGDPENFRPERFLETKCDSHGEKYYSMNSNLKENVVLFQPGKRTCPGENLARDIIFLAAAKLLKKFRFSPEPGRSREEYLRQIFGFILIPTKIGVLAQERREGE